MSVLRRPTQPHAERAGERGLHHPRIRTGMPGGVATPRPQRPAATRHHRRAHRHQQRRHAGRDEVHSIIETSLRPSRTGRIGAIGDRSSRRGCWRRGRPAARAPRRARPTAAEPPAHRRCSRRPTPAPHGQARRRRERPGRVHTRTATDPARRRRRPLSNRSAIWPPVRDSDVPPSATKVAAAVIAATQPAPVCRRRSSATPAAAARRAARLCGVRLRSGRRSR